VSREAIDAYIARRAAEDASYNYRTLVAFSGGVRMDEDEVWVADWGPAPDKDDEFTEANMNPGAGADLAAAFKGETFKIMLVANKFQTGFDQPLLSAMYVEKKLSGVTAVQTLSRLNRTHRTVSGEQKRKTFVIDFVNKPEDIKASFEPYFKNATLETETDPTSWCTWRPNLPKLASTPRTTSARSLSCGSPARATTRSPRPSARHSTTSHAATPERSRRTTRSPSTPSTCSARTSPPTCGSTTS